MLGSKNTAGDHRTERPGGQHCVDAHARRARRHATKTQKPDAMVRRLRLPQSGRLSPARWISKDFEQNAPPGAEWLMPEQ